MAWAVVVPKGGDGVGKEVDAFRQRLEWIGLRVGQVVTAPAAGSMMPTTCGTITGAESKL